MSENYAGIYEALVHDVSDPTGQGRARLLVPAVLGQAMSAWARPVLGRESALGIQPGDRAWVLFEHGELNRPTWFATSGIGGTAPRIYWDELLMAYPARPIGVRTVDWYGPVAPSEAISTDNWVNTE